MRFREVLGISAMALLAACTAEISSPESGPQTVGAGDSGAVGGSGAGPGEPAGPDSSASTTCHVWEPGCTGDPNLAPPLSPRLLTKRQYDNTITLLLRDVYGVLDAPASFAKDLATEAPGRSGFAAAPDISPASVEGYTSASKAIAAAIEPKLSALVGCDVTAGDDVQCLARFVRMFGQRLYRRPLSEQEVADHVGFYQEELTDLGRSKTAATLSLVRLMLNSPYFLYEWEQGHLVSGRKGGAVRLNAYQIAARLAFFLWASGPDPSLVELAASGGLDNDEQVAARAKLMLASPRAAQGVDSFHEQWLDLFDLPALNKNTDVFANWSPALGQAMASELRLFTREVILNGDASVATLLTSTHTYLNGALAKIYDHPGVAGSELRPVAVDAARRSGLLTMPGFLASASGPDAVKPFHLGNLLLEKLFCQKLVPADPDLIANAPTPSVDRAQVGERAYLEALTGQGVCAGCHTILNPLAFGLGNFDALGAWREADESGVAVSAAGQLNGESFSQPVELGRILAKDEQVQACVAKQWFRFATDSYEGEADTYSLQEGWRKARGTSLNVRALMLGITATPSFLYRTPAADEPAL